MKPALREVLAASHVAAISIAVLLFWFAAGLLQALSAPLSVAILDIPYFSRSFTLADRATLMISSAYLYSAAVSFSAAWLLARWIYGMGPFRSLAKYRGRIVWRNRA